MGFRPARTCQFSHDGDDLSEPAAETVYRVVQEAVTNAMKHAPGAPIDIVVLGHGDDVEVRVGNEPAFSPRALKEPAAATACRACGSGWRRWAGRSGLARQRTEDGTSSPACPGTRT